MQTNIQKWGNSLAIRIPKAFTKETGIKDGSTIDITLEDGKIIVKPLKVMKYSLNDLLKKVNKENLHNEIESGDSIGNETW